MIEQAELSFPPAPSSSIELPTEIRAVASYLSAHCQGHRNAATSEQLAAALGMTHRDAPRELRALISLHHDAFPFPLCGKGGTGWFIATEADELAHYDRTLYSLLKSVARRLSASRRCFARCGYVRTGTGPHTLYHRSAPAV